MLYLGIDTSNYTTSVAAYDTVTGQIVQRKKLLPVKEHAVGLRQSDAVFAHIKQLPELIEELSQMLGQAVDGVGVSTRPRDVEGSYMPCFLCGEQFARGFSALNRIPLYRFSHQAGHIMAALYSCGKTALMREPFLAFHVSGGTTEALLVTPHPQTVFEVQLVASSLDLKAGQAIDRTGVLLSLPFPCGRYLDELYYQSKREFSIRPVMRGTDCSLSGIQNHVERMFAQGDPPCDIAKYCIEAVKVSVEGMTKALRRQYPQLPLVYAGGVMSNTAIRRYMEEHYGGSFADPMFSSDNAAGIALLAAFCGEGAGI